MSATAQALRTALTGNAAVSALVDTRIYAVTPRTVPAGAYVIFQQIAADPGVTHDGASGATERLFQFACFASTYEAATALRDAVITALDGVALSSGELPSLEDERDGDFDEAAQVYRADADFSV